MPAWPKICADHFLLAGSRSLQVARPWDQSRVTGIPAASSNCWWLLRTPLLGCKDRNRTLPMYGRPSYSKNHTESRKSHWSALLDSVAFFNGPDSDQNKIASNLPNPCQQIFANLIDFLFVRLAQHYYYRSNGTFEESTKTTLQYPTGICHSSANILKRHCGDPGLSSQSVGWFLLQKVGAITTNSGAASIPKIRIFQIHVRVSASFTKTITWGWVDISIHFGDVKKSRNGSWTTARYQYFAFGMAGVHHAIG